MLLSEFNRHIAGVRMKGSIIAITLLCLVQQPGHAQVFNKCVKDGKVVFTDQPCDAAAARQELRVFDSSERVDEANGARLRQENAVFERQQEAARLARKTEARAREDAYLNVLKNRVGRGMSADEVLQSWGKPSKINRTVGASGVHEQWVYRSGPASANYVYLDNGVVTSYQVSR